MDNLIPDTPSDAPNYWCTWSLQNYFFGQGASFVKIEELEGARGASHARNNLTEELLLGKNGWATNIFKDIRRDLLILLDDGWDLPLLLINELKSNETKPLIDKIKVFLNLIHLKKYLSSFYLHSDRFPSIKGSPEECLKSISDKFKKMGWKGMGVWLAAQEASKSKDLLDFQGKKYWKDRVSWSKYADIRYWKVDWGLKMHSNNFRKFLTLMSKENGILVEHAHPRGPFNNKFGDGLTSEKYIKHALNLLKFSDIYRTYDVSPQLSVPSTLDRVTKILINSQEKGSGRQLINCEDEVYIAAALGCVIGVMRHPYRGLRMKDGKELDFAMPEPRSCKFRIDEVIRAVKWHRIAPPFASSAVPTYISKEILYDEWLFKSGDFWDKSVLEKTIKQGAPMIVARGITLPEIKAKDKLPWVIVCRNPNGAVSIATLGRIIDRQQFKIPRAEITLHISNSDDIIGIFGKYKSLNLKFDSPRDFTEIWSQDLKGGEVVEISNKISRNKKSLTLSSELIEEIGLRNASEGDISDPGFVIKIV